ncbi:MAG: hypothetical protein JNK99_08275 [Candidatus Accumulibacter sp.]|uniref:PhaM family polyhydroxyalkanoate granule multifunctional regulatory protein n=1 Tax=Accumulibacter sp. TaxID=2053492 RepID=UPI001A498885|nr:PhaM family polyhydroxyalkanoate granule multifunctional regulatory protein [Accumulibacter sp.]MBL8394730.1 hypothetical protein [Accumulibacter sp.]
MSDSNSLPDPLSFARKMWGGMGVSLPGMVTPSLNIEDIEKKIRDLKAVENWLKMNLSMLQMTIQGLEMQCVTLNAVRAMGQMASSYGTTAGTEESAGTGGVPAGGTGNEALRQAALWPLTLLQQMQEQMQKAAAAAMQAHQPPEDAAKP